MCKAREKENGKKREHNNPMMTKVEDKDIKKRRKKGKRKKEN